MWPFYTSILFVCLLLLPSSEPKFPRARLCVTSPRDNHKRLITAYSKTILLQNNTYLNNYYVFSDYCFPFSCISFLLFTFSDAFQLIVSRNTSIRIKETTFLYCQYSVNLFWPYQTRKMQFVKHISSISRYVSFCFSISLLYPCLSFFV